MQKTKKKIISTIVLIALLFLQFAPAYVRISYAEGEEVVEETPVAEVVETVEEVSVEEETTTPPPAPLLDQGGDGGGDLEVESSEVSPEPQGETEDGEQIMHTEGEVVGGEEIMEANSAPEEDEEGTGVVTETTATPTITTGEAVATANIVNILNTNLINSSGEVIFANLVAEQNEDIDFREDLSAVEVCNLLDCSDESIKLNFLNNGVLGNDITIEADSGENVIDAPGAADATISTGDAFVGLNLVNLVNSNFVDSQYLLIGLNAFRNVNGDIVFPSLSNFFNPAHGAYGAESIDLENTAAVDNNLDINTNSGDNTGDGESNIETGQANSSSNVLNQINTTLNGGGDTMYVLLRIQGDWAGEVFGLPEGLSIQPGLDHTYYITNQASSLLGTALPGLEIDGSNNALIGNNITMDASSGSNTIIGAENSTISTGDAFAGANILNIANTNVIGRNWMLAIINIFGNFTGNVAFGRPDLWIGEQVETPKVIKNDSVLTYKYTIINRGDAEAREVRLRDDYDFDHLEILSSSYDYSTEGNDLTWNIGTLLPGGATEITYKAKVKNTNGGTDITNTATLLLRETDDNDEDNTDTATVRTRKNISHGTSNTNRHTNQGSVLGASTASSNVNMQGIMVNRTTKSLVINKFDEEVTEELLVSNTSKNTIKGIVLHDILYDKDQNIIHDEMWNIGDILPREDIILSYKISFNEDAAAGIYTLSTILTDPSKTEIPFTDNGSITLLAQKKVVENVVPKIKPTKEPEEKNDIVLTDILKLNVAHAESSGGELIASPFQKAAPVNEIYVYLFFSAVLSGLGFLFRKVTMI